MADTLRPPLQDIVSQRAERNRTRTQRRETLLRPGDPRPRLPAGGLNAVQRGVRSLLLALVAAGGLAQLGERAFDVENIIDDLKGEPEALPRLANRRDIRRSRAPQHRAHAEPRADQLR